LTILHKSRFRHNQTAAAISGLLEKLQFSQLSSQSDVQADWVVVFWIWPFMGQIQIKNNGEF